MMPNPQTRKWSLHFAFSFLLFSSEGDHTVYVQVEEEKSTDEESS